MVDENEGLLPSDKDVSSEMWKEKCLKAKMVYDSLSDNTKLKVSEMVKVSRRKLPGLTWMACLVLVMELINFQCQKGSMCEA